MKKKVIKNLASNQSLRPGKYSVELQHVTREMYKKNAELASINRTLSILQKINTIILSSVTDLQQVSNEVVGVIVSEAEFKRVCIYIVRNHRLSKLASSVSDDVQRAEFLVNRDFPGDSILLTSHKNLYAKAIHSKKIQITEKYSEMLPSIFSKQQADIIQKTLNVRSSFVYPLIVRDVPIGVISIDLGEDKSDVSEYDRDLMTRIVDLIGIALDNALLFESLERTTEKLKDANIRLKELDKLKDEFVSIASHELRTPLTVIRSYVELMRTGKAGKLSKKQEQYLSKVFASSNRLSNLVNTMLDLSRIESGRIKLSLELTDMNELIKEVTTEMKTRAEEQKISLVYQPSSKKQNVLIDKERIREVLINLIGNSLKYTPAEGAVSISLDEDKKLGEYNVVVKDTGIGISQQNMTKLFKKFGIIGSEYSVKKGITSTGLGLYLSQQLVQLHGGKIWVESEGEGKGSTFTFSIPLRKK